MFAVKRVPAYRYPLLCAYFNKYQSFKFDELFFVFENEYKNPISTAKAESYSYFITIRKQYDYFIVEFELPEFDIMDLDNSYLPHKEKIIKSFVKRWRSPDAHELPGAQAMLESTQGTDSRLARITVYLKPEESEGNRESPMNIHTTGRITTLEEINQDFLDSVPFDFMLALTELNQVLDEAMKQLQLPG